MSYERNNIRAMEGYTYGEQPSDKGVVKLNTNENPYPPSPLIQSALKNFDSDVLRRYPDPSASSLRKFVASRFDVSASIEHPLAIDLLEDRIARDVAGEKIRGELDALGIEDEGLGKPLDELGLAETRETLEENVTPGKNSGDDEFDQFLLAEENLVEGADKRPDMLAGIGDFGFRGVLHIQ